MRKCFMALSIFLNIYGQISLVVNMQIGMTSLQSEVPALEDFHIGSKEDFIWKLSRYPKSIYSNVLTTKIESKLHNLNRACATDIERIRNESLSDAPADFALEILDSIGKPPAGIRDGNNLWFGSFQQCKSVQAFTQTDDRVDFNGKYCFAHITVFDNLAEWGVCVPDSCSDSDAQMLVETFLGNFGNESSVYGLECVDPLPWRTEDIVMVVFLSIFGLLVLASTIYDYTQTLETSQIHDVESSDMQLNNINATVEEHVDIEDTQQRRERTRHVTKPTTFNGLGPFTFSIKKISSNEVLKSFSLLSNWVKVTSTDSTPKGLESLNGIRVITIIWLIIVYMHSILRTYAGNYIRFFEKEDFLLRFIAFRPLAFDTLFFLSGFLVALGSLKALKENNGKLNWALFYINRFLRWTPVYIVVICFAVTICLHWISGPYESEYLIERLLIGDADGTILKHFLFIINFFTNDNTFFQLTSWYISCEAQFFIVSPIFIYALYRKRPVGYVLVLLGIISNLLAIGIVSNKYGVSLFYDEYYDRIYTRPYYRIAPYLVGIACADIYLATKNKIHNMTSTQWKVFITVMWILAMGMNVTLVYGAYPYTNSSQTEMEPQWLEDMYESTYRFAWSLTCAWIAYACLNGWGGFVTRLLSLRMWEPMNRLCFLAFLLHPIVISLYIVNLQQKILINYWILTFLFVSFVVITFAVAVVFYLLVELPLSRLQRALLGKN